MQPMPAMSTRGLACERFARRTAERHDLACLGFKRSGKRKEDLTPRGFQIARRIAQNMVLRQLEIKPTCEAEKGIRAQSSANLDDEVRE